MDRIRVLQHKAVNFRFGGTVKWNGSHELTLEGDFGDKMKQTAYWRENMPVKAGQTIDVWLEYTKTENVHVSLEVTHFESGTLSEVIRSDEFDEEQLKGIVHIEADTKPAYLFFSLNACGSGELKINALRIRQGDPVAGGKRYVTSHREEIFSYFEPGDGKPPLNVIFSDYNQQQGFEHDKNVPFLLILDLRLDGGAFYMGSEEYESTVLDIIHKHTEELGFSYDDVILSGIGMGASGAVYYGCDINPHAVVIGKPLLSLGDMAANEKYIRPGGFPVSLDILKYLCGGTDMESVQKLNDRFWNKFDASDWGHSTFAAAYMIEDDFDETAYGKIISHLQNVGVRVYGKGFHGRHNDDDREILKWFSLELEKIIYGDFR